jgi:hypothetical protein
MPRRARFTDRKRNPAQSAATVSAHRRSAACVVWPWASYRALGRLPGILLALQYLDVDYRRDFMRSIQWFFACVALLTVAGCETIGNIFQAGIWVGVLGVILVVALLIWLLMKAFR